MSDNSLNASLTPPGAPSHKPPDSAAAPTSPATKPPEKSFADVAIERGYCTAAQIDKVRDEQRKSGILVNDLSALLVKQGVISLDQSRACERAMKGVTVIAGFEILEKVGQGGMGAVFRARQISMDRIVALKVLPPKLAQDALFKKRFMHEARLSAKLSHLNIISGIDCGEAGGFTYFAMEFVDGKTLKQILKANGKFPPADAYGIIRQMAVALVYAQTHGLVHRDIKPDNIMLTSQGVAKLCDLGLAKQTEAPEDASMTQAGQAVGTPHYISPEQARGEKNCDARSDIYSLGCTFYHMLAARTPFDAPTGASVMALHITAESPNPCDTDPAIPLSYGRIISKMMAKSANDRYASGQALLEDLDAAKGGNIPKAVSFKGKTSCAMPRRANRTEGPLKPVADKAEEATAEATVAKPDHRIKIIAGAAAAILALGTLFMSGPSTDKPPIAQLPPIVKPPEPPVAQPIPPVVAPPVKSPDPVKTAPPIKLPVEPIKTTDAVKVTAPADPAVTKPPDELIPTNVKTPEKTVPPPVAAPADLVSSKPVASEAAYTSPKLELGADLLYARVLTTLVNKGPTTELSKLETELRDMTVKSEFTGVRDDINAELSDMAAAMKFEQAALKAMAATGGMVDLTEETARKFNAKQGKITGFDSTRGLAVDVLLGGNRIGMYVSAVALPISDILKASPDVAPLSQIRYLAARGQSKLAVPLLEKLGAKDQEHWQRKVKLMASGPNELLAEATYANLAKMAEEKNWWAYQKLAEEFDKLYGTSNVATDKIVNLTEWKVAAKQAGTPAEGMEVSGKFVAQTWPKTNPAVAKVKVDKDTGNKILTIEGEAGEGEKCALTQNHETAINLTGKTMLVFRSRHNSPKPLKVAFGFFTSDSQYFESTAVPVGSKGWHENTIKIDGAFFKGPLNGYSGYDQDLTGRSAIHRIAMLVYSQDAYQLEIDGIVLK